MRSVSRGAGLRWRPLHTKYAEAPTEPAGETKSFCPCQKERVAEVRLFFDKDLNPRGSER